MNREDNDFEKELEMDFKDIEKYMDEYMIEFPAEEEIEKTINMLRPYVPQKARKGVKLGSGIKALVKSIFSEAGFMSKGYWLGSSMLFVLAYLFITIRGRNPYMLILAIAPTPFVFGLVDVFRGREEGVWEIEASCKTSIQEIVMRRLFLVSIYSVLLNMVFTLLIGMVSTDVRDIGMIKLTLLWSAPFALVSAVALWVSAKIRNKYTAIWIISVYMGTMLNVLSEKNTLEKFLSVSNYIYASVLLAVLWKLISY